MNNHRPIGVRPHVTGYRASKFTFLLVIFVLLTTGIFVSTADANSPTHPLRQDTTAVSRVQHDISALKKHIQINGSQEDYIFNMFLAKYQYLEVHEATGPRWEFQVENNKRKLRELLGKEAYLRLDKAGLIGQWFGVTQEK